MQSLPERHLLLNIGLRDDRAQRVIPADDAFAALARRGLVVLDSARVDSDTEPTLVALIEAPYQWGPRTTHEEIFGIAEALGQDAIGAYGQLAGWGSLIGPRAAAWGSFNPALFFLLDGTRLANSLAAVAA